MLVIILACLLAVMGILVKYFKLYGLIAGYNTASAAQREQIDAKGLANFVGNFLLVISAILSTGQIFFYYGFPLAQWVSLGLSVILIAYMPIGAQKFDQNPKNGKAKSIIVAVLVFGVLLFSGSLIFYGSRPTSASVNNGQLEIAGMYGTNITLTNVTEVSLLESMPAVVRKINGFDFGNILRGNFLLQDMGEGKLYVYSGVPPYLYISMGKDYIILNHKDPDKTRELYSELLAQLE